jgi:hypothetical protein
MSGSPTFGGVPAPDRARRGEWLLVQWVATARPGDPFPEPWCHAHDPLRTMIGQLVDIGVIALPPPDADIPTIAREASAAAKAWLEQHPEPPLVAQQVPRRMVWGPGRNPYGT